MLNLTGLQIALKHTSGVEKLIIKARYFDQFDYDKIEFKTNSVKVGYLSDGRKIVSRDFSSKKNGATSYPTNELQHIDGTTTKIRYY